MLTDIFARRYEAVPIWSTFDESVRCLLVQSFQLLGQIIPFCDSKGDENAYGKAVWMRLHTLLARELGVQELSPTQWGYWGEWMGNKHWYSGKYSIFKVCENWMLKPFDGSDLADRFIKERLSLAELGFRARDEEVAAANAKLPENIKAAEFQDSTLPKTLRLPGSRVVGVRALNKMLNDNFRVAVDEFNARFRQAGVGLHYHNGFIQFATDPIVTAEIEAPFWDLVSDPKWQNVDYDMKVAIDLRDTDGRDPALYAAKALESTIKIVSDTKQYTTGKERGAANFIDSLRRGGFLDVWEVEALKHFFAEIRNPLGHGAGSAPMPSLNRQQTDWAIEHCMSWIKSLIRRM